MLVSHIDFQSGAELSGDLVDEVTNLCGVADNGGKCGGEATHLLDFLDEGVRGLQQPPAPIWQPRACPAHVAGARRSRRP